MKEKRKKERKAKGIDQSFDLKTNDLKRKDTKDRKK
jgi:hypothetical protein